MHNYLRRRYVKLVSKYIIQKKGYLANQVLAVGYTSFDHEVTGTLLMIVIAESL